MVCRLVECETWDEAWPNTVVCLRQRPSSAQLWPQCGPHPCTGCVKEEVSINKKINNGRKTNKKKE